MRKYTFLKFLFVFCIFISPSFANESVNVTCMKTLPEGNVATCTIKTQDFSDNKKYYIKYQINEGNAKNGDDFRDITENKIKYFNWYYFNSMKKRYVQGNGTYIIKVQTIRDTIKENNEDFYINIQISQEDNTFYNNSHKVTITENLDLQSEAVEVYEGEIAKVKVWVRGDLSLYGKVKVYYTTDDLTAKSNINYTPKSGTLIFDTSNKIQYIEIQTHNDGTIPLRDPLVLHINFSFDGNILGYTKISIKNKLNNIVSFAQTTYNAYEGDYKQITIQLKRVNNETVTIDYKTQDAEATAGEDYISTGKKLIFAPNETEKTIIIHLLNDNEKEDVEKFYIELINPINTIFGLEKKAIVNIIDNDDGNSGSDVLDKGTTCISNNTKCININVKDFSLRYGGKGYAKYAEVDVAGATILCQRNEIGCNWDYKGYLFDSDTITTQDDSSFQNNSSSAILKLPDNKTGADIIYARLYWQGHIAGKDLHTKNSMKKAIANWDRITFKTPDGLKHNLKAKLNDRNWYSWWADTNSSYGGRFFYQANVDVTNLVKNSLTTNKKTFTAGNIVTSSGKDDFFYTYVNNQWSTDTIRYGYWGGWSLIVVYEGDRKKGQKYKNIAIYDGFQVLTPWKNDTSKEVDIPIIGFYTPKEGNIDSKMIFLAFGGEKNIQRDYFKIEKKDGSWANLENETNPSNNPFNGSITNKGVPLVSDRLYNSGMDLDTYDISKYISHQQTKTRLKLGGYKKGHSADQSFPSMIAFSTEIYSPKLCYEEHIYYKDQEVPNDITPKIGSILNTQVSIRNEGHEDANKIRIFTSFDQNYSYVENSFLVGNVMADGKAGPLTQNSPLLSIIKPNEYNDANVSIYLGRGASSSEGGTFKAMKQFKPYFGDEAKLEYNMTFFDPNFKEKQYFLEYENKILGLHYQGQIYECLDANRNFKSALGDFNVVNEMFNDTQIFSNQNSEKNALFTQVVGQPFNVKILHLESYLLDASVKQIKPFYGNNIYVDIVQSVDYASCNNNEQCIINKCKNAHEIPDMLDNQPLTIPFNQLDKMEKKFTCKKAAKNVMFRVKYNENGEIKCSTSVDNFSIRPASYSIDLNNTVFVGKRIYRVDSNATNINNTIALNYNTNKATIAIDNNFIAGCELPHKHNENLLTFNNGLSNTSQIRTENIGDYNITVFDNEWTYVDQNKTFNGVIYSDCIQNNSQATHDTEKKVGCKIEKTQQFNFIPLTFRAYIAIQNFNQINQFTYVSNNTAQNMMATLQPTFEAVLDDTTPLNVWDNPIATAYDKNCYAHEIEYDLSINNISAPRWTRLTGSSRSDIHYDDVFDPDTTIQVGITEKNTNPITVKTRKNSFALGVASPQLAFNFDRTTNVPHNPITINNNDFNISRIIDTTEPNIGINNEVAYTPRIRFEVPVRLPVTEPVNFYYGRAWCPDVKGRNLVDTSNFYEVFCQAPGCTPIAGIMGHVNSLSNDWYVNIAHRNPTDFLVFGDGFINSMKSTGVPGPGTSNIVRNHKNNFNQGREDKIDLIANTTNSTYTDTIQLMPHEWLLYNRTNPNAIHNDCTVTYLGSSQWSGRGQLGHVLDDTDNVKRSNRRIQW